jgi:hypothetical protein
MRGENDMSDDERQAILRRMRDAIAEAETLTSEQARQRLAAEGFCDDHGRLSPAYGGKVKGKP